MQTLKISDILLDLIHYKLITVLFNSDNTAKHLAKQLPSLTIELLSELLSYITH